MREPGSPRGGGRTAGGTRFDPGGVHAIREAPPGPRLGCEPIAPILARRPGSPIPGPDGSPATRPLLGGPSRLIHHAGPAFRHVPWSPLAPSGLVGAPPGASDLLGRAPRHSASEAGFRSAPCAMLALAPLVVRPAVYPTGPAARGYDAGDDMTTSRPLGCMHPWSSSVGRGDRGEIILTHRTL